MGMEWEDGILVKQGVHYATVFEKGEEKTG